MVNFILVFEIQLCNIMNCACLSTGLPTLIVVVCGSLDVYGKHSLNLSDPKIQNSTAQM